MSFRLAAAAAVAAIIAVPGPAGAQVLSERNVSAHMALTIAETALAECGSRVSVAVVDRTGRLRGFFPGAGGGPHHTRLARRRAPRRAAGFPPGRCRAPAQHRAPPPQGLYGGDVRAALGRMGAAHRYRR